MIITVNNADNDVTMNLPCTNVNEYVGALSGEKAAVNGGRIQVKVPANGGEIWLPGELRVEITTPIKPIEIKKAPEPVKSESEPAKAETEKTPEKVAEEKTAERAVVIPNKPYEEMTVEELQEVILGKMRKNGPVTEYMLGTVRENTHHGSLVTWAKSF